VKEKYKQM
jgi:uncharacterized membrane protein YcgQ (UPF0703/DUF1980 family)